MLDESPARSLLHAVAFGKPFMGFGIAKNPNSSFQYNLEPRMALDEPLDFIVDIYRHLLLGLDGFLGLGNGSLLGLLVGL